jgi:hypothetical protein
MHTRKHARTNARARAHTPPPGPAEHAGQDAA